MQRLLGRQLQLEPLHRQIWSWIDRSTKWDLHPQILEELLLSSRGICIYVMLVDCRVYFGVVVLARVEAR